MSNNLSRKESIEKIRSLIKDIKFAMLTTEEDDGSLRSRPMATQQSEFDGTLWFFTAKNATKVKEVDHHHEVNVSYSDTDKKVFVSVSGYAELIEDKQKIKELWNPLYQAWFPDGLDDPELALLKVNVYKAEYWDSDISKMVALAGFIKSKIRGEQPKLGKHEKVNV